jgi:hypothetical protein
MEPRKLIACLAVLAGLLLAAGCGSSAPAAPAGLTISGPGLQTSRPPWPPEYEHLSQRLREAGLPPGGSEAFHHHALLHIYNNGILVPLAANIGLEPAKHLESPLHTHDHTGIIHMEAAHPFKFTLGDFFMVWGVKFGPEQLGALKGYGGNHLHFYLNGRPLANPAAHVLANNDSIVIGYGPENSFPHAPSTLLLKEVEAKNGSALNCTTTPSGKSAKSCFTTTTGTSSTPAPSTGSGG